MNRHKLKFCMIKKSLLKKITVVFAFPVFHCFFFIGCQVDPGSKKHSILEGGVISKIVHVHKPSVDILFIIDDSGSMADIHHLFAKNAKLFVSKFLNTEFIDYHIGVTSSSASLYPGGAKGHHFNRSQKHPFRVYGGELARCKKLAEKRQYPYPSYVDRNTPEGGKCLSEMMRVGHSSPVSETFFNIPGLALDGPMFAKNFAFYRSQAHLAVFVITDSFDQSGMTPQQSYQFLLDLKNGDEKKLHYAAVIVSIEMFQYNCALDAEPPFNFIKIAKLFGNRGYLFNLCQFNFGNELALFASHLVDATLTIPLDHIPNMNTINVHYEHEEGSQVIPNGAEGWSYNGKKNSIQLSRDIQVEKKEGTFKVSYKPFYTPGL